MNHWQEAGQFLLTSTLAQLVFPDSNMVELPPLRFVKETSKAEKVNMEAVVIDIDEQEIEDVEEVRRRLEGVDDLNTEADVEDISGGEGLPSDEEGESAIPDLEDENAVYAQVTKKKPKDKKADIDPEKARQEIAELEGLIEKANVAQDLHSAAAPTEEEVEEDQEWDEEMAKRRRRSNSYEDTIKNMDPDLVRELGLAEGEGTSEDERDTASRIEDRANEKAANGGMESNGNGARRRSRSRSRSRPPNLETVEENYSKEYQGGNIGKTDGFNNFSLQLIYGCHRHSYRDINGYFQLKPTLLIKSNIPGISVLQARGTSALEAPRHQGVPLWSLHSDDS